MQIMITDISRISRNLAVRKPFLTNAIFSKVSRIRSVRSKRGKTQGNVSLFRNRERRSNSSRAATLHDRQNRPVISGKSKAIKRR